MVLREIFSEVYVVRAEHLFEQNVIRYTAISEHFEEISDLELTPGYGCHLASHNDAEGKIVSVTAFWKRR